MTQDKKHHGDKERRAGKERRKRDAAPDAKGMVASQSYTGADRRAGGERRSEQEIRDDKIWREKKTFLNNTVISAAFLLIVVIYASYFLLAPEIREMNDNARRVHQMEQRMAALDTQIGEMKKQAEAPLGSKVNQKIEQVQNAADNISGTAAQITHAISSTNIERLIRLMTDMQVMNSTQGGRAAMTAATARLHKTLGVAGTDAQDINSAVQMARKQDKALDALLDGVGPKDLGAAALLISLNELRGNIDGQRPFEQDLAVVQKLAGADPEMQMALQRLAPFAQRGVLSRAGLQKELGGLASDIVMAKLTGEDLSVSEAALKRMGKFVKVRRTDDLEGNSVDATVARAQALLDKNDVRGAMRELQTLEGPPAAAAAPWMEQAAGHVIASESSSMLTRSIMESLSMNAQDGTFSLDSIISSLRNHLPAAGGGVSYVSPAMLQNNVQSSSPAYPSR